MSGYDPEQSHRERVEQALDSIDTRLFEQRQSDARAQLWVGMYLMRHWQFGAEHARACDFADAAVRDFDEHYLGGKR